MRIVEQKCNCSIQVMPITDYPENSTLYNPTWEDSGVFTLIYKIDVDGTETLVDKHSVIHVIDGKYQREVYDLTLADGRYKVLSFIVPTKQYLIEQLGMVDGFDDLEYQECHKDDPENLISNELEIIVAADENSPTLFSFTGRRPNPSPYRSSGLYYWMDITNIDDLLDEVKSRDIIDGYLYGTNIKVIEEDYFQYCNLYKCFINKASALLDQYKGCSGEYSICNSSSLNGTKCKSNVDQTQIQIRDYLWMVINAIKYALECNDYETANKLLNCVSTCDGICNNETSSKKQSNCGCS